MATISTLTQMKNYILRELGAPVINIEIETSTGGQLEQIIDDSAEIFNRYMYGEGSYWSYLAFSATSGTDEYSLSGNNIQDVFDFDFSTTTNGINTLFSPLNMTLYSDWVIRGNYPGAGKGSLTLSNYYLDMNYLEDVQRMFQREYRVDWIPGRQVLKISPTPNETLTGILFLYKKSLTSELYNNIKFRELCVAKAMIQWGRNIAKYDGVTFPGGGQFNSQQIKDEGKELLEKALNDLHSESEPIDMMIG